MSDGRRKRIARARAHVFRAFNPFWHRVSRTPRNFQFLFCSSFFHSNFTPLFREPPGSVRTVCARAHGYKVDFRRVWHRQSRLAGATAEQFHGLMPQMEDKSFYASHREPMSSTRKFVLTAFVFIIPLKIQFGLSVRLFGVARIQESSLTGIELPMKVEFAPKNFPLTR